METIGHRGDSPVTFKASEKMRREIEQAARAARVTKSTWIRAAIEDGLVQYKLARARRRS